MNLMAREAIDNEIRIVEVCVDHQIDSIPRSEHKNAMRYPPHSIHRMEVVISSLRGKLRLQEVHNHT